MTDFQVGDRVRTIVGTVAEVKSCFKVAVDYGDDSGLAVYHTDYLELVERPRRKLRVGSVWECALVNGSTSRFVVVGLIGLAVGDTTTRAVLTIDTHPSRWREVPVEELEAEAQG